MTTPIPHAPAAILVVEDHIDLAEALQVNLEDLGHQVTLARDARQALFAVRAGSPDLIVLDLGLPGVDGLTLLEQLRGAGCWCPVLILTARAGAEDKVDGFRRGADDYVTKPFHTQELLARIAALLRRVDVERRAAPPAPSAPPAPPTRGEPAPAAPVTGAIGFSDADLVSRFGLSERQAAVARMMAEGWNNPEIAEALGISRFTARNHATQVLARLGIANRGRLAATLRAAYDREQAGTTG